MNTRVSKKIITTLAVIAISPIVYAAATLTAEDIGDVFSFGKPAIFASIKSTSSVILKLDCSNFTSFDPNARCVKLDPVANTNFDERKLGIVNLPAGTTETTLCHLLSPSYFYSLSSQAVASPRQIEVRPYFTVLSPVLNDPSFNAPNGELEIFAGGTYSERDDGLAIRSVGQSFTRACNAGMISKSNLIASGVPEAKVDEFFATPMTIQMHLKGSAQRVSFANLSYSLRLLSN